VRAYAIVTGNPFASDDGRLKVIKIIIGGTQNEAADAYNEVAPANSDMWWAVEVEDGSADAD